jgi:hypothetical protein
MNIIYPLAFVAFSLVTMTGFALWPLFFSRRDLNEANGHEEDEK